MDWTGLFTGQDQVTDDEEKVEHATQVVDRFLHQHDRDFVRKYDIALRKYAKGAMGPEIAEQALGIGDFYHTECREDEFHFCGPLEWGWSMNACANGQFPFFSSWIGWWFRYATMWFWFRFFGFGLLIEPRNELVDGKTKWSKKWRGLRLPFCRVRFLYPRGWSFSGPKDCGVWPTGRDFGKDRVK